MHRSRLEKLKIKGEIQPSQIRFSKVGIDYVSIRQRTKDNDIDKGFVSSIMNPFFFFLSVSFFKYKFVESTS